jgi:prepilin-type processing-associated H-X9-DG protein
MTHCSNYVATSDGGREPGWVRDSGRGLESSDLQYLLPVLHEFLQTSLVGNASGVPYSGLQATNWAAPFPNFGMFFGSDKIYGTNGGCIGTFGAPGSYNPTADLPAWALANRVGQFENIVYGQALTLKGTFPFVNSGHPNGANYAFCDGAVRFRSNTIDGTVYSKIITPAGTKLPLPYKQLPVEQDAFIQ